MKYPFLKLFLLYLGILFVANSIVVCFVLSSCDEEGDGCEPEATRCTVELGEELAQVCNADQIWQTALNCTEINDICCEVDGGVACLPEEDCTQ
jgi:hypothetical protein